MCLFQLDESMCPCQESFTFPFFLGCCFQPWHCIYLLYLFLGVADSTFGTYAFLNLSPYPCLTSFKWDQVGKKTKIAGGIVKYKSKNKSIYSKRNDGQFWAGSFSRSFAIVFNEIRIGHLVAMRSGPQPCDFSSRPSQNSGVFKSGSPLVRTMLHPMLGCRWVQIDSERAM